MQTTTPHFVLLCQLLVQASEELGRAAAREAVLDRLMEKLMAEGLVFDRAWAGQLYDQLQADPEPAGSGALSPARIEELRRRVRSQDYFNEAVLQTMGERLLWVLRPS